MYIHQIKLDKHNWFIWTMKTNLYNVWYTHQVIVSIACSDQIILIQLHKYLRKNDNSQEITLLKEIVISSIGSLAIIVSRRNRKSKSKQRLSRSWRSDNDSSPKRIARENGAFFNTKEISHEVINKSPMRKLNTYSRRVIKKILDSVQFLQSI